MSLKSSSKKTASPPKVEGPRIIIRMSEKQRDELHALARLRKFPITSDYIRKLIEADAKLAGVKIDLSVDRGGYRGRKKETP